MGAMLPPVRQVFPVPRDDVDPVTAYAGDERPGRWLLVNMISSIDGATAIGGRSGGLGGAADKEVFRAIRSIADVILVGAGTVRAENYGPPTVPARLAIVSASLNFDPKSRLFADGYRPTVITHAATDADRRDELQAIADVVVAGEARVDLRAALSQFDGTVLCEGGPSLNGELLADDLVDELCLTVAPVLIGGTSSRIAQGAEALTPRRMRLARLLQDDGCLFFRFVRSRGEVDDR